MKRTSRIKILVGLLLFLSACGGMAGPSQAPEMVSDVTLESQFPDDSPVRNNISISSVSGGANELRLQAIGGVDVSSKAFFDALSLSLARHGLLSTSSNPPLTLSADLDIHAPYMPFFSLDVTTTAIVTYHIDNAQGQRIFDEKITTSHEAEFGSALIGAKRAQIANEEAVRKNIAQFLKALKESVASRPGNYVFLRSYRPIIRLG